MIFNKKINFPKIIIFLLSVVIFIIFIASIWDRNTYVGGDLIFPLNPQNNILKTLSLWDEENGGFTAMRYLLLLWEMPFYLLSLFNFPVFLIIKIFLFFLYLLGFIFTVLFFRFLLRKTKYNTIYLGISAAFIFFLSAASILVLPGAIPLYAFPICSYFLLKYIKTKKLSWAVIYALAVNISFFPDLVQGKNPFIFILSLLFLLPLYAYIEKIKFIKIIGRTLLLAVFTVLLNFYIIMPFIKDEFGSGGLFSYYTKNVTIYDGNADMYTAALPYISRFFCSNLIDKSTKLGQFLISPYFIFWSFFLWFLAVLGLIITKDKKEKTILYSLLTATVFFIFFAKGPNPPFGSVYHYLIFNIPVFKIFRTTATIVIGGVLSFAVLTTLSINKLFKGNIKILLVFLSIHLLVFHPVYLGYKIYNFAVVGPPKMGVSIPPEYYDMGKILDNLDGNRKVASLPGDDSYASKFWYFGQSPLNWLTKKPFIHSLFNGTEDIFSLTTNESCLMSKINNIGYVIKEKDSVNSDLIDLNHFPGRDLVDNDYFKLRQIDEKCLLSTIYIPQTWVRFFGRDKDLLKTAENVIPLKSIAYINDNKITQNLYNRDESFKNKIADSNIVLIAELNNTQNLSGIKYRSDNYGGEIQDVFYPYVRISPGSFLYPVVEYKEKNDEKKYASNSVKFFRNELLYASKRISEIEKWGIDKSWSVGSVQRYRQAMERAVNAVKGNCDECAGNLNTIYAQLNNHREKIENLAAVNSWSAEQRNLWIKTIDGISKLLDSLHNPDNFRNLVYKINFPKTDSYTVYINNQNRELDSRNLNWKISIDGKTFIMHHNDQSQSFIKLDSYFIKKGNKEVKLDLDSQNLLLPDQWEKFAYDKASVEGQTSKKQEISDADKKLQGLIQEVTGWEKGTRYHLEVEYSGKPKSSFQLLVAEDINMLDKNNHPERKTVVIGKTDIKVLASGKGKISTVFVSDKKSFNGKILFLLTDGNCWIDKAQLSKIINPDILFVKENSIPVTSIDIPRLSFEKISPVKYNVHLENITSPFLLAFAQAYNPGWKISYSNNLKSGIVVPKLFNADISEIPEYRHLTVNGYVNGWFIDNSIADSDKKADIVIEYQPQRLFNLGLIISLATLIIALVFKISKRFKTGNYGS